MLDRTIMLADFGVSILLAASGAILTNFFVEAVKKWIARKPEQKFEVKLGTGQTIALDISPHMSEQQVSDTIKSALQFLLVKFKQERTVLANGNRVGLTNHTLMLPADVYVISLEGRDYTPPSIEVHLSGTAPKSPKVVEFH